jgi:hypothetical protein
MGLKKSQSASLGGPNGKHLLYIVAAMRYHDV